MSRSQTQQRKHAKRKKQFVQGARTNQQRANRARRLKKQNRCPVTRGDGRQCFNQCIKGKRHCYGHDPSRAIPMDAGVLSPTAEPPEGD